MIVNQNKNFRSTIIIILSCVIGISTFGQKTVTNQDLIWYGVFTTVKINEKWYFQNEVQERHFVDPLSQHQLIFRGHIHHLLGKSGWEGSVGMCLFLQNPNDPYAAVKLTVPELRPHLEMAYKQKLTGLTVDHRYRAEARFFHNTNSARTELEDDYNFENFRFRYRIQATVPLFKINEKQLFKVKVSDEILINAGSNIVNNLFDQNRLYAGISWDWSPDVTFDVGYLHWFQQRPSGDDYFNRNILRFTLFHKINLEKPKLTQGEKTLENQAK